MWRERKTLLAQYNKVHALVHKYFQPSHYLTHENLENVTQRIAFTHIKCIQHLKPAYMSSHLEFLYWVNINPQIVHNILFIEEAHFACNGVKTATDFLLGS